VGHERGALPRGLRPERDDGVLHVSRLPAPVRETGHGDIVLDASTSAIFGEAGNADYTAAKSALAFGFARTLKNEIIEIARRGRVNVVAPGWTATSTAALTGELIAAATQTMPLKRIATPEEVAQAIVWLASPVASHCSGQLLEVAGGMEGRVLQRS
jgi:3-oxoacyl-[acyl-carrier protein] reductase